METNGSDVTLHHLVDSSLECVHIHVRHIHTNIRKTN